MATRADYRELLNNKFLGLDEEGYGDFEYEEPQLNDYLKLAVLGLFPSLFQLQVAVAAIEGSDTFNAIPNCLTLETYGTLDLGSVSLPQYERVYSVEDYAERQEVLGWRVRNGRVDGIDTDCHTAVNVHYYVPVELPENDVDDAGIGVEFTPVIILGAVIEALESRHDTGLKTQGEPLYRYTGVHEETSLIDRLRSRYQELLAQVGMTVPGAIL